MTYRAHRPETWPPDKPGYQFLHRALARLLWERGGTVEAAESIRADLRAGRLHGVYLIPEGVWPIEPDEWDHPEHGPWLLWEARGPFGDVYLKI